MNDKAYNVLFLCTHNSARSILAEGLMNHFGGGRFKGFSAGSHPSGRINPLALEALEEMGYNTTGMYSKSWDIFAVPSAPIMDFVFTVCNDAAGEICPLWLGHPNTAHWRFADPSAIQGDADMKRAAFTKTRQQIADRIHQFLALPVATLDTRSL